MPSRGAVLFRAPHFQVAFYDPTYNDAIDRRAKVQGGQHCDICDIIAKLPCYDLVA